MDTSRLFLSNPPLICTAKCNLGAKRCPNGATGQKWVSQAHVQSASEVEIIKKINKHIGPSRATVSHIKIAN